MSDVVRNGYIVGVHNPNFSGLAQVQVAEKPDAYRTRDPGAIDTLLLEAGFGVRQLVHFFGSWELLKAKGPTTLLVFTMSDISDLVIESFEEAQ